MESYKTIGWSSPVKRHKTKTKLQFDLSTERFVPSGSNLASQNKSNQSGYNIDKPHLVIALPYLPLFRSLSHSLSTSTIVYATDTNIIVCLMALKVLSVHVDHLFDERSTAADHTLSMTSQSEVYRDLHSTYGTYFLKPCCGLHMTQWYSWRKMVRLTDDGLKHLLCTTCISVRICICSLIHTSFLLSDFPLLFLLLQVLISGQ